MSQVHASFLKPKIFDPFCFLFLIWSFRYFLIIASFENPLFTKSLLWWAKYYKASIRTILRFLSSMQTIKVFCSWGMLVRDATVCIRVHSEGQRFAKIKICSSHLAFRIYNQYKASIEIAKDNWKWARETYIEIALC